MHKTLIKNSTRPAWFNLGELWECRELLYFLIRRNIKIRYSQTFIGVLWVVLQPVTTMLIFSVIFGRFAKLPSEGVPYTMLVFSALLPWNLFAGAMSGASTSLVMNRNLVTKIYFPRIIVPMAKVIESMLDFCISFVILLGMMLFYKIPINRAIVALPVFILWVVILALGAGFWASALNVKYRDVTYAIPFLAQIWLYVSPVAYSLSLIPRKWQGIYSLNPVVGIIECFRWSLLAKEFDFMTVLPVSFIMTLIIFITGVMYFCHTEKTFADII